MNMYHYFIIFFSVGLFMVLFPILASSQLFLETDFSKRLVLTYFGIGSALMGVGIGLGVGHLAYREKGAKNVD